MELTEAQVAALDTLSRTVEGLGEPPQPPPPGNDLSPYCPDYRKAKPVIEAALPIIGDIPVVGEPFVEAIEFLMKVADWACPDPRRSPLGSGGPTPG